MYIQIVDCNAPTRSGYANSTKTLEGGVCAKKICYLGTCVKMPQSFMPLIYSIDGCAGKEAKTFKKRVVHVLVE